MIFSLVQDFADVLAALPEPHPRRRILALLDEALRRDAQFIDRHSTTLFQCLWNSCWWYDCPEAAKYYAKDRKPSSEPGEPLHNVVSGWLAAKRRDGAEVPWLRSLRPPPSRLRGRLRFEFGGEHGAAVRAVAFSADGQRIVSIGTDGAVCVRDLAGASATFALPDDQKSTGRVAFYPDGRVGLLTDGTAIRCWDGRSGTAGGSVDAAGRRLGDFAVSSDGRRLVAATDDGGALVWNIDDGRLTADHPGTPGGGRLWAVAADVLMVAWVGSDKQLHVHEPATGEVRHSCKGDEGHACLLAVSPDGRYVATAAREGSSGMSMPQNQVRVYDGRTLEILWEHDPGSRLHCCLAFSPDGGRLALASSTTVAFFRSADGAAAAETIYDRHEVNAVAYSADGCSLATGTRAGDVRVWRVTEARRAALYEHSDEISAVAVAPAGDAVVTAGRGGGVRVWSAENGRLRLGIDVTVYSNGADWPVGVNDISFSADGRSVAAACENGSVMCWDGTTGEQRFKASAGHRVFGVHFSPDGLRLASVGEDKVVSLWGAGRGERLAQFTLSDEVTVCVRFSPDGRILAVGCHDGWIRRVDAEGGAVLGKLGPHSSAVRRLEYSGDGASLVTVAIDSLRVWRVADGTCERSVPRGVRAPADLVDALQIDVVSDHRETTLQTPEAEPVAWLPGLLKLFVPLPGGGSAAAAVSYHFFLFAFEGPWPGSLDRVRQLLDSGRPAEALALLEERPSADPRYANARGVCFLRLGQIDRAREEFRALVFAGAGVAFAPAAPALYKANFAATLLAEGRIAECLARLNEIGDEQAPGVHKLRQAIAMWQKGRSPARRLLEFLGRPPELSALREIALGDL